MNLLRRHVDHLEKLCLQGIAGPSHLWDIVKIVVGSTVIYALLVWATMPPGPLPWWHRIVTVGFFVGGMGLAWYVAWGLMIQLARRLYDLSTEEAADFTLRLFYGVQKSPPKSPTLVIRQGRILPSSPEVVRKVGGPAFISVGHESAVVMRCRGYLNRVLGPGFHTLRPFETSWDEMDLRPQRREVTVKTYTRDGIPITCEAEVRFNLDNGQAPPHHPLPFNAVSEKRVLQLTTGKVVLGPDRERRFASWSTRIARAILDGLIRDWIEHYRLNDLISPTSAGEPMVARLQQEVEAQVREIGQSLGVWIDRVDIKSLRPDEEHISKRWLEIWRADWDYHENRLKAQAKAAGTKEIRLARLRARARLLTEMEPYVQASDAEHTDVRTLRTSKFLEAVQAMADIEDPIVRSNVFHQAKELYALLDSLEEDIAGIGEGPEKALEEET
ncbi:MAG: SPFH domain-containing protein [Anaerolineae bacterium]